MATELTTQRRAACRLGAHAALITLAAIVASGPLAVLFLTKTHPQPPWAGAEVFARSFHLSQTLPYFAGFALVGGYAVWMASLHQLAADEHRPRATAALVFTSAFVALVFLNYIVQTTFVPELARRYAPQDASLVAALAMANPTSLAWAIEMWAWALFGVATWLVAPVFSGSRVEQWASMACVANGVVSVATAVLTALRPGWGMSVVGLVSFTVWNALVFAMSTLAWVALRRRLREDKSSGHALVVSHAVP